MRNDLQLFPHRRFRLVRRARRFLTLVVTAGTVLASCRSTAPPTPTVAPAAVAANEHTVLSVLWTQTAAEIRALQLQAFHLAQLSLERELRRGASDKRLAVIVDIDETVLDNSPYQAQLILDRQSYPVGWNTWTELAQARAIPGAVEFLDYAVSRGVDVFYVSNRRVETKAGTMRNLQAAGFPQVEESHMYLRTDESSKETRRQAIAETHRIVLLMGDNLNDFAQVFENKSVQQRFAEVDALRDEFGRRFVVLPNAMYGDWEGAVYGYDWGLSEAEKDSRRKGALEGLQPASR